VETCPTNGGTCYTDPAASTCAGYTAAYPQYVYTSVSGTCNEGVCCSRADATLTCQGTCYPGTNTCAGYTQLYPQYIYTTASGTCNDGEVCCSRTACPAEVTCTTDNCEQNVANGTCGTKLCGECPTASVNMFYCKTSAYGTCSTTSSTYTSDPAGKSLCNSNLDEYVADHFGDCYFVFENCVSNCVCTPSTDCAPLTCVGETCNNGCAIVDGTKTANNCASLTCVGQTCNNGCAIVDGTKTCPIDCPPDSSCASSTCTTATCNDDCGNSYTGTNDCITPVIPDEPVDECDSYTDCDDGDVCTDDVCSDPTADDSTCSNPAVASVNGVCGLSSGLCTSGIAGSVSSYDDRTDNWSCTGSCGGTNASCFYTHNNPPTFEGLIIKNNLGNVVSVESGNRNQICQTEFNSSRTVTFEVEASDPDGDTLTTTLTWNGKNIPLVNSIGTITLDDSFNDNDQHSLVVTIDDGYGSATYYPRDLKIWNCEVSVTGTGYDGSSTDGTCSNADSFVTPVSSSYSLLMNDVSGGTDKLMTVTSPTYSSGANPLIWGQDYLFDISDFAGSDPVQIKINGSCSNIQFTVDDDITDPYASSVSFVADFSSVIDQDPWWQTSNGGAVSNDRIESRVPVTCATDDCKISLNALTSASTEDKLSNTGRSLSNCQDWYYFGRLANINTNYTYFFNQYFVRNGVGTTLIGDKSIADITSTGVYFVNGDLTIDANKTINSTDFLMIIVNGDINVSDTVNRVDGILVAKNINATGSSGNQLVFNGSLFAHNEVNFSRGYSNEVTNNTSPSVVVNYSPQLVFNLPGAVAKVLTNWQWGN
jgi:hypothetical protein